jgi:hypothetical protein
MNSYFEGDFDETFGRQIEQFNQRMEDAASFQKHMLSRLCAERIRRDLEEAFAPPIRIRTVRPQRQAALVGSVLEQAGRVGKATGRTARRVLSVHRKSPVGATREPQIIDGEYIVLDDGSGASEGINKTSTMHKEDI